MKKFFKKLANRWMIRLCGHIPFPDLHEYKVESKGVDLICFYLHNVNPINTF